MHTGLHISLAAERLGTLWGLPITNTLVTEWVVMVMLITTAFFVGRNPTLIPGKVQNFFEMLFEFIFGYIEETLGTRALAERFFPLITTIFVFVLVGNWLDFFPIIGSIGIFQNGILIPIFHPVNSDLNSTLALAIIAFFVIEITGVLALGVLKYGSKFVNLKGGAMGLIVGVLELFGNVARLVSFSFRLFGNVFAGEVLIAVIVSFLPYFLPVPLMLFETFVGFLQAAIFALLTLVFIKIAISEPHEEHGQHEQEHPKLVVHN